MAHPRMTAEIGRVLGGRYRLVAPIGMGASAQVYLADDVKLRRRVALKMLHDALAGDAEFLRRFRAEARAAAALSHPNVMAVYDWSDGSDDGDAAFIVTEYLAGGSLRSMLDAGDLLSPGQALGVGLEAARALDYAHRRGFVHRDIKPANLLFGDEERLRIADFGLARALAEAAWTEPQGAVLGTARYASPEQAKGETLTGKADVYSLALTIIEAVTGEVPFVADTTLGTLMARVDRPLVVPDELGPLQSVLAGAGHPNPEQRIDARSLAKGLLRAAQQLSRPSPLPLAGALAAGLAVGPEADPTVHGPDPTDDDGGPNDLTADDLELEPPHWVNQSEPPAGAVVGGAAIAGAALAATGQAANEELDPVEAADAEPDLDESVPPADDASADARGAAVEPDDGGPPTEAIDAADVPAPAPTPWTPAPTVAVPATTARADTGDPPTAEVIAIDLDPAASVGASEAPARRRRRRWPWVALLVVLLVGAGGGVAAYLAQGDEAEARPMLVLPVPDLVGLSEEEATEVLEAAGWQVTDVRARRNDTVRGEVLAVSPVPGRRLEVGRTITITVSDGQEMVDVPGDLVGLPVGEAQGAIEAVGLVAEVVETPFSEEAPLDRVIGLVEGTPSRLERGSTVPLVVSAGPEPRTVPSGLAGSTEAAAIEALEALGLQPQIVRSFSDDVNEGIVISVLPASGATVPRGEVINVEVSRGPELIPVPDISGADSIAEAVAILGGSGLEAGSVSGPAAGSPQGSSPGAGELVRPGSSVDIVLG